MKRQKKTRKPEKNKTRKRIRRKYIGGNNTNFTTYNGNITDTDKNIYSGPYLTENGIMLKNGKGEMKYANGDVYSGNWESNQKSGQGSFSTKNDAYVYNGEWDKNQQNGKGNAKYANGDVYDGDWKNDFHDGTGKMTYANGSVYTGNWKDGKKNGNGTMTYANGSVYTGNWENGKKSGNGELKTTNKYVYNGYWKDNQQNGEGKATYANGDVYNGQWVNDMRNGKGIMKYKNKNVLKATWKEGTPDTTKEIKFTFEIVIGNISYNVLYKNATIQFLKKPQTETLPGGYAYNTEYTYDADNHTLSLDKNNTQEDRIGLNTIEHKSEAETENLLHAIEEVLYNAGIIQTTAFRKILKDIDDDDKFYSYPLSP